MAHLSLVDSSKVWLLNQASATMMVDDDVGFARAVTKR